MLSLKILVNRRGACAVVAIMIAINGLVCSSAGGAPVAVRFPEGIAHGFLILRSLAGEIIGQGEMTQVVKEGDQVEGHLVFTFKDGSLHDEKVTFSQQRVFTMLRYHLVQRGPSFPDQIEVSIDRSTSEYKVRSKAGSNGHVCHDAVELTERGQWTGQLSRLHAKTGDHQTRAESHG